jgi:hypothetical protein
VAGTMTDRVPTVTEVRLRFNCRGRPSPVTIGLHDIRYPFCLDLTFFEKSEC